MTKADLVQLASEAIGPGITKKDCALVVDGLLNAIKGSLDGPTWAGATELALSAARTSEADRSEIDIETAYRAVNSQSVQAPYKRTIPAGPSGWFPVSRGTPAGSSGQEMPPALSLRRRSASAAVEVNPRRSFQR